MPFITKHTFNTIIRTVDLNSVDNPKRSNLENLDLWMLSKKEKQRLLLIKQLFQDIELNIDKIFFKLGTPTDSLTMVYPERSPSYHKTINCKALNKEYQNFQVPSEIRERGMDEVYKFRKWFSVNSNTLLTNPHGFHRELTQEFKLENEPEYLTKISSPNSGANKIQNTNILELEEQIDELIKSAEKYKYQKSTITLIINKYGGMSHHPPENYEEKKVINEWHRIKTDIKGKVFLYFMIKFNPDIELGENILDELGLNKCPLCHGSEDNFILFK